MYSHQFQFEDIRNIDIKVLEPVLPKKEIIPAFWPIYL